MEIVLLISEKIDSAFGIDHLLVSSPRLPHQNLNSLDDFRQF